MDFSAFHTTQKTMASTLTGTVSRVSVDSAGHVGHAHALVHVAAERIHDGNDVKQARARAARCNGPRRSTATFSHWSATRMANSR